MEPISDIDHATAVVGSVCARLDAVRGTAFWKIGDADLLSLAETLERVGRLVYAAQVHLTGEIDTRRVFQDNGAVSTAALLRQRLCISPGDAAARVRAA
ncbi:MAG TPA: HNH endonuclease, partial [Nakamurella sp.]